MKKLIILFSFIFLAGFSQIIPVNNIILKNKIINTDNEVESIDYNNLDTLIDVGVRIKNNLGINQFLDIEVWYSMPSLCIVSDQTVISQNNFIFHLPVGKFITVDWGDGNVETLEGLGVSDITFNSTYTSTGIYNVKVSGDVLELTRIYIINQPNITSISGISNLTNLTYLRLAGNNLTNIGTVTNLTNLTYLNLYNNFSLTNIGIVTNLTNLTYLDLYNNNLTDIGTVTNLINLIYLRLDNNFSLTNIGIVTNLTNLTYLRLDGNSLTNIGIVTNLTNLTYLSLGNNSLTDIGIVTNLTNLTYLYLYNNNLTDIGTVTNLTNLTYLYLYNNNLTDIGTVTNLINLIYLRLDNNNFNTAKIDAFLSGSKTAYIGGATFLSGIQLQENAIPTGGATNADYIYLTSQGISVTIDE